jgi:ATP-dependent Lhr-like helicase
VQNFLRTFPLGESAKAEHAEQVLAVLREQGASFLGDIAAWLNEPPSQVAAALWELMWAGLVTNDSLAPVWAGRPDKKLWRPGRKRARGWVGGTSRWSAFPLPGGELTLNEIEAVAQRLLARYGLLCRETLELEQVTISWSKLYPVLTRLEWQGAVERGLFVSDLSGAQFALRETVDGLLHSQAVERPILLSTCDPVNHYGPSSPFPIESPHRETGILRRHPANFLVMQNGRPVLAIENRGERLTLLGELSREQRRAVLALLPELLSFESGIRAIKVTQWDGKPVGTSVAAQDLQAVGFMREDLAMIYYRQYSRGENA